MLLLVIVGLARVPVLPAERPARAEPHELALLPLVRAARPEVLVPQPDGLDVLLQLLLVLDHGDHITMMMMVMMVTWALSMLARCIPW